jgi:hypothetical protein
VVLDPAGHAPSQLPETSGVATIARNCLVKYDHHLVGVDLGKTRQVIEQTVDYLMGELGPEAWTEGMHPEIPETRVLDNPYTYTYTEEPGATS